MLLVSCLSVIFWSQGSNAEVRVGDSATYAHMNSSGSYGINYTIKKTISGIRRVSPKYVQLEFNVEYRNPDGSIGTYVDNTELNRYLENEKVLSQNLELYCNTNALDLPDGTSLYLYGGRRKLASSTTPAGTFNTCMHTMLDNPVHAGDRNFINIANVPFFVIENVNHCDGVNQDYHLIAFSKGTGEVITFPSIP